MKNPSEKREIPLSTSTSNLHLVLKAWPVITLVTIGMCFLTQLVSGWLGFELKEQANVDLVRNLFVHAFDSWKYFGVVALNTALILVICPVVEELIFRWGLFKGPRLVVVRLLLMQDCGRTGQQAHDNKVDNTVSWIFASVSSTLFSAAHYLQQPWPDNAFIALFFFGCAQCWLYRKTGKLWCAMLNHTLFNLTNLVLMFFVK